VRRLVVGLSGASGVIYGIRLLKVLRSVEGVETHLVISNAAKQMVLLSLPWWGTPDQMRTLVEFIYFLALAQMWNLLAGYGGMVSFGQQAWIGLGGYTLIVLADDLRVNTSGPPTSARRC